LKKPQHEAGSFPHTKIQDPVLFLPDVTALGTANIPIGFGYPGTASQAFIEIPPTP
jgi:hypothetical protein